MTKNRGNGFSLDDALKMENPFFITLDESGFNGSIEKPEHTIVAASLTRDKRLFEENGSLRKTDARLLEDPFEIVEYLRRNPNFIYSEFFDDKKKADKLFSKLRVFGGLIVDLIEKNEIRDYKNCVIIMDGQRLTQFHVIQDSDWFSRRLAEIINETLRNYNSNGDFLTNRKLRERILYFPKADDKLFETFLIDTAANYLKRINGYALPKEDRKYLNSKKRRLKKMRFV